MCRSEQRRSAIQDLGSEPGGGDLKTDSLRRLPAESRFQARSEGGERVVRSVAATTACADAQAGASDRDVSASRMSTLSDFRQLGVRIDQIWMATFIDASLACDLIEDQHVRDAASPFAG